MASPAASPYVDVLVPFGVDRAYTYRAAPELALRPGDVVAVPLGTREVLGVVWDRDPDTPIFAHNRLRDVTGRIDMPPVPETLRRFVEWGARYNVTPAGNVLRMVLRKPLGLPAERPRVGIRRAGPEPARMTPARAKVLALLEDGFVRAKAETAREAGVGIGVVDGLIDEGTLETVVLPPAAVLGMPDPDHAAPALEADQAAAGMVLREAVAAARFAPFLLEGVTGSGKTETYFEAVAEAVKAGRQSLILLPEIALTASVLDRFSARFGVKPAEWHSGVSQRLRARYFDLIASGEAKIVVGARSALFLPFAALGLIVVDEEHDQAYKQEEGVPYHARDMAVVRARLEGAPVVLASATPSIETRVNADRGRYRRLALPERFGGRVLPKLAAIDLRRHAPPRGQWLAAPLVGAIRETLARSEQALLFLNRRGYAPLTLCRACGHRFECPNCTAWLVEHRFRRRLMCHHCGYQAPTPANCPACGAADSLIACGPGVERVAEEARALFPEARMLVLSSDMAGGITRLKEEIERVAAGEVDLVIGTQIVAKGHNFPKLTLVGVVDADLGLAHGDPRAAERTFQLLQQVTGRAGRGIGIGQGFLQTHLPEHPVLDALVAGDPEAFYAREIAMRELAGLPPFGRLAGIVVSAKTGEEALRHARALAAAAPAAEGVTVLGPAEAPIAVLRGLHRQRLLVKAARTIDHAAYVRAWLAGAPKPRGSVTVDVDIDPQSFL